MSESNTITTGVLRALAYYDVFDYPLTIDEFWRWYYPTDGSSATVEEVQAAVKILLERKKIAQQGAYYFFPGRQSTVDIRTQRTIGGAKLWRRATSTARFLELVPFIKMVAVVNTLAIDNARPDSDIDLFIVTAPEHIWITRLLITGIVSLLGYRRHDNKIAGRVCLSFYVTGEAMDMSKLQIKVPDTYLAYWTAQAVPLLDNGTYEKYKAANQWVEKLLPQAWSKDWSIKVIAPNAGLRAIRQFYEIFFTSPIGQYFESMARDRQMKKMSANEKSKAALGTTEVIISEDVLKFHERDRRQEYNDKFRQRLTELGIND